MAALVTGAGLGVALLAAAGDDPQSQAPSSPKASAPARPAAPAPDVATPGAVVRTVKLQIQITGVSTDGCVIEIRPGHPGCKFKPLAFRVKGAGGVTTQQLDSIPIRVTASDRDCSFAITLREPGGEARTFRRGLRLNPPAADGQPSEPQSFPVFLSSPSLAAQYDAQSPVRR
jgi:hypothetical protein